MPGICPRCLRNVYFAEEKLALGKVWHNLCFSCRNCKKLLDSCTVITYEGDLYCKKCCPRPTTSSKQQDIIKAKQDITCCCCCCCCCLTENSIDNHFENISKINNDANKSFDDEEKNFNNKYSINSLKNQLDHNLQNHHLDASSSPSSSSSSSSLSSSSSSSSSISQDKSDNSNKIEIMSLNFTSLDSPRLIPDSQYEDSSVPTCLKNLSTCRRVSFKYKEEKEEKDNNEKEIMKKNIENDNSLNIIDKKIELNEKRLRGGSGCCCNHDNNTSSNKDIKNHHHNYDSNDKKNNINSYEEISCGAASQGCGSGGNCGGGCRGNCGKSGQSCLPIRTCTTPNSSNRRVHHYPPVIDTNRQINSSTSNSNSCTTKKRRQTQENEQQGCNECQPKTPVGCECLGGGGLDCQRCGKKVYHAEMHFASGVPYHSICFSCHCCRKPLETLTYHENCGEIYCKQCYVRNFGPQGYGYSGVLQTPM